MEIRNFDASIEKFIESLEKQKIAKVLHAIDVLEEFGPRLGMPHSKKVARSLFELRVRGEQEVRIFYTFHRSSIVLIHGFVKKSQQTPKKEIRVALQRIKALD
jgi:phage-related protein